MAFFDRVSSALNRAAEMTHEVTHDEAGMLFDFKREALQHAKSAAEAQGRMPTLEDYRLSAEALGHSRAAEMEKHGIQWSPQIYADLSGQTLDGFRLSSDDQEKALATARDLDLYDSDGNGKIDSAPISKFYDNVSFSGATIKNGFVEPATSYNDQIAQAGTIENMTFKGLKEGDQFNLGGGHYANLTCVGFDGGDVHFHGSHVDGLHIAAGPNGEVQKFTSITLDDHASVKHMDVSGAHIVSLTAAPGVEISHSQFKHTTIDSASHLEGTRWKDVQFENTNLCHVDMHGAQLSKVDIKNSDLHGLNLHGATIRDLTIDGKPIASAQELAAYGVDAGGANLSVSPQLDADYKRTQMLAHARHIGNVVAQASKEIGQPAASVDSPAPAATEQAGAIGISGGDHVGHDDIGVNLTVAQMQRTVPVAEQAHGGNMVHNPTA
jgi:uncharacterized protein YjbI with pentapeptide repeats